MEKNSFCPSENSQLFKYINQKTNNNTCISEARYDHLFELAHKAEGNMKISLRNPHTEYWTKWLSFFTPVERGGIHSDTIENAFDVHRSILNNEIIVESDYPDYKDNVEAAKLVGRMIESKGYIPHYYYSGSKSLHIHIFIDFSSFNDLPDVLLPLVTKYFQNKDEFFSEFIIWLRRQMITCWGLNLKEFDKALIKSTHLIRAELSMNKKGFKTFLGYKQEDLSDEPFICNPETKNYPSVATIGIVNSKNQFKLKESTPDNLDAIVEEFLNYYDKAYKLNKIRRKDSALGLLNSNTNPKKLRKEVQMILDDKFASTTDGMKRALFILCNELKRVYPKEKAMLIAKDWNLRMGEPLREYDVEYRINSPTKYLLKTDYIREFLTELGLL